MFNLALKEYSSFPDIHILLGVPVVNASEISEYIFALFESYIHFKTNVIWPVVTVITSNSARSTPE